MKSHNIIVLFLLLLSSNMFAQTDSIPSIKVSALKENINDSSHVILDVRTVRELSGPLGKIDSAVNIPISELEDRIDELLKYKDKEIDVICRSGRRSLTGTKILVEHGYNAKNVLGGMKEFRRSENK